MGHSPVLLAKGNILNAFEKEINEKASIYVKESNQVKVDSMLMGLRT